MTPPRVALALAKAAAGGRCPSGVCTATSTRPRAPRGGLCGVPCGPLTGCGPRGDGACAIGLTPWRAAAPRAGRRRWTRPPRQWPHRRSRRPRGSQGDGPHPSPCGRASVVRAFDGRRGSVCSPRLSEGSATRATPRGPWGSRGRRRRSAPPGRWPGDGKARRVGAGSGEIYLLERDILVVQVDSGRDM